MKKHTPVKGKPTTKKDGFEVNYDKKTLKLFYEGEEFNFDLNDGDVGDFWHSLVTKGVLKDINFSQEDADETPCVSIYDLKEEKGSNGKKALFIDTDRSAPILKHKKIGKPSNYFDWMEDEEDESEGDDCPNCGSTEHTWRNGSSQLQCDNCGHSEE